MSLCILASVSCSLLHIFCACAPRTQRLLRHRTSAFHPGVDRLTVNFAEDMNLSNLLHKGQQNPRQQDPPRSSQLLPDSRARPLHDHSKDMASALTASPYISQSRVCTRSPQPPPSPPIEEPNNLRTLPSIQSLIGMDVPPPNDEQHR